ncbi:hypothetical protein [Streptomyces sp. NPDC004435]|uniref:hypothetical protein n=1 Tax=Streptomyces sp. NPDC004435 TaxID=3364701 RepID=UPI003679AF2E
MHQADAEAAGESGDSRRRIAGDPGEQGAADRDQPAGVGDGGDRTGTPGRRLAEPIPAGTGRASAVTVNDTGTGTGADSEPVVSGLADINIDIATDTDTDTDTGGVPPDAAPWRAVTRKAR